MSKPFYNLSLRLAAEFAGSRRLRMHTDCNPEQSILVYPYFRDTLLALIREDPELPFAERRKILRHVAEALSELHSRDWIHIGTTIQCPPTIFNTKFSVSLTRSIHPRRCKTRQHPRQLDLRRQRQQDHLRCNPKRFRHRLQVGRRSRTPDAVCNRKRHVAKPGGADRPGRDKGVRRVLVWTCG